MQGFLLGHLHSHGCLNSQKRKPGEMQWRIIYRIHIGSLSHLPLVHCRQLEDAYKCAEFLSDADVTKLAWPTVVREKMHKHVASKR